MTLFDASKAPHSAGGRELWPARRRPRRAAATALRCGRNFGDLSATFAARTDDGQVPRASRYLVGEVQGGARAMFEEAVPQRWPAGTAWSLAASFLLHVLLAVAIVTAWSAAPPSVPLEEVIPVNLLIGAWPEAVPAPGAPDTALLEPPPTAPPETAGPLMHAATILSGQALAEPRNRKARDGAAAARPDRAHGAALQYRGAGAGGAGAPRLLTRDGQRLCHRRSWRSARTRSRPTAPPCAAATIGTPEIPLPSVARPRRRRRLRFPCRRPAPGRARGGTRPAGRKVMPGRVLRGIATQPILVLPSTNERR